MSETPIYDDVLTDTGVDPEPIRSRERWSLAKETQKHAPAPGLGRRVLTPG